MYRAKDDTENLDRNQLIPELTCLHAEDGSRTHGRAGALEAALDEITDLFDRVVATEHQNQCQQ